MLSDVFLIFNNSHIKQLRYIRFSDTYVTLVLSMFVYLVAFIDTSDYCVNNDGSESVGIAIVSYLMIDCFRLIKFLASRSTKCFINSLSKKFNNVYKKIRLTNTCMLTHALAYVFVCKNTTDFYLQRNRESGVMLLSRYINKCRHDRTSGTIGVRINQLIRTRSGSIILRNSSKS